jgi:hypothetical protein
LFLILVTRKQWLTSVGRRFLAQVQTMHHSLREGPTERMEDGRPDPALVATMGLFGIAALEMTSYAYCYDLYKVATVSNTGAWASSVGSSCASSCGGGGCGGGGCGGCGS